MSPSKACVKRVAVVFVCLAVVVMVLPGLAQATTITIPNTYWVLGTNSIRVGSLDGTNGHIWGMRQLGKLRKYTEF